MTTMIDDQVRDVLARQAAALPPPSWHPAETPVRARTLGPDRQRRGLWLATAAAGLAVVGGLAAITVAAPSAPSDSAGQAKPADDPLTFGGAQVLLLAESVRVELGDRTFTPVGEEVGLMVHSDPGDAGYTTLELTWFEYGVEMRINLYFASDGADWWLSEARTYDGAAQGDWLTASGEWARSPLGTRFEGDLTIGTLHMNGVRLEAFMDAAVTATTSATEPSPTTTG